MNQIALGKDPFAIKIEVFVRNDLSGKPVPERVEDQYDEQTLEDWYDFAANVEGIIDRNGVVTNISLCKNSPNLSEHLAFYRKDEKDNRKDGVVDLRLSDQSSETDAPHNMEITNQSHNDRLVSIVVNERSFDSYESALQTIEALLCSDEFWHANTASSAEDIARDLCPEILPLMKKPRKKKPNYGTLNVYQISKGCFFQKNQNAAERWAKQRAKKGFCANDLWDFGHWIPLLIRNALKDYRKTVDSIPGMVEYQEFLENKNQYPELESYEDLIVWDMNDSTKDAVREKVVENAHKRWLRILDEMIGRFEQLLTCLDCCEDSLFEDDDFDKLKEATDRAFELYKQYCYYIW